MKYIALVLYGDNGSTKNAFTDDNYKELAAALTEAGFNVETVLYNCSKSEQLKDDLTRFDAVISWVNPKERTQRDAGGPDLDDVLLDISQKGVFVSTHPEVIQKIGTKKVLHSTRGMDWGGDIELYTDYADFEQNFISSLNDGSVRILKQHRGESGRGIFKVRLKGSNVSVTHAASSNEQRLISQSDFFNEFKVYFDGGGLLVSQPWIEGIVNGMVRCYLTGAKVSGFGYQEAVALCPDEAGIKPMSRRFYFSEDCGLFQDLRKITEAKWVPQLQKIHSILDESLPLLWDIDFFINDVNAAHTEKKYTLCEMNVSCVSPFPPSCVKFIVDKLKSRLR